MEVIKTRQVKITNIKVIHHARFPRNIKIVVICNQWFSGKERGDVLGE
jgi:hypothetical protein